MTSSISKLIAILLVALTTPAWALPAEQVPEDAKWLVYFNARELRHNPVAEAVRHHHQDDKKAGKRLEQMKKHMGLKTWDDLESFLLYGRSYRRGEGILLINGRFDREAVAGQLKDKPDYELSKEAGRAVHSWTYDMKKHGKQSQHTVRLALLPNRALMTRDQAIGPPLGVLEGKTANLNSAQALLKPDVPAGTLAYMEASGPIADNQGRHGMRWLRKARHVRAAVSHEANSMTLSLDLTVPEAETAIQFKQLAEGFRAMIMLRRQGEDEGPILDAVQAMRIDVKGNVVMVRWTIPNDQVIELMKRHHRRHGSDS
jgi:hypothetical protein